MHLCKEIKHVLDLIEQKEYEAYIVGGYVRDSLLNIETYDVDITTSAPPIVLKKIFEEYNIDEKFLKYGCVRFNVGKYHVEITTFRKEYEYINHRKPNKIEFVCDLKEDLIRRDFTINSLCFNNQLIDIFDGLKDLNNKVIKTIGNPYTRFEEDALRILRALRFSSKLSFEIENETKSAIKEKYKLLKEINFSTLHKEIIGILNGINYISVLKEYKKLFMDVFSLEKLEIDLFTDSMNIEQKEALFFYYSSINIKNKYLEMKNILFYNNKIDLKMKLYRFGEKKVYDYLKFKSQIIKTNENEYKMLNEIIDNEECYSLKMLDISGEDMLQLNVENYKIGKYLEELLFAVIKNKCANKKEMLIKYLKNNIIG